MNRKQIIAELRRAAASRSPWYSAHIDALMVAYSYTPADGYSTMLGLGKQGLSTFYLLVACALEDEQ